MFDAVPKGKESEPSRSNLRRRRSGLTLSRLAATSPRTSTSTVNRSGESKDPMLARAAKGIRQPRAQAKKAEHRDANVSSPGTHSRHRLGAGNSYPPQNNHKITEHSVTRMCLIPRGNTFGWKLGQSGRILSSFLPQSTEICVVDWKCE